MRKTRKDSLFTRNMEYQKENVGNVRDHTSSMIKAVFTVILACLSVLADTQGAKSPVVVVCTGRLIAKLEPRPTLRQEGLPLSPLHLLLQVCQAGEEQVEEASDVTAARAEDAPLQQEGLLTQKVHARLKRLQMTS